MLESRNRRNRAQHEGVLLDLSEPNPSDDVGFSPGRENLLRRERLCPVHTLEEISKHLAKLVFVSADQWFGKHGSAV